MTRHNKEETYSLQQVVNYDNIYVDIQDWDEKTAQGLARFTKKHIPNWKCLIVTKKTVIVDSRKKGASNIVSQKRTSLTIGRIGAASLCTLVDENFEKDGQIPHNIWAFFGNRNNGR